jgi:hypothetical protein
MEVDKITSSDKEKGGEKVKEKIVRKIWGRGGIDSDLSETNR